MDSKSRKYAIKVRFDDDVWLYVTHNDGLLNPIVSTYDTFDAAQVASTAWRIPGKENNVIVVEYDEVDDAKV